MKPLVPLFLFENDPVNLIGKRTVSNVMAACFKSLLPCLLPPAYL